LWRLNCIEFHRSVQLLGCTSQFLLLKIPLCLTVRLWLLDLYYFTWMQNRFWLVYLGFSWLLIPKRNCARLSKLLWRFASRLFDNLRSLKCELCWIVRLYQMLVLSSYLRMLHRLLTLPSTSVLLGRGGSHRTSLVDSYLLLLLGSLILRLRISILRAASVVIFPKWCINHKLSSYCRC
jgi:hypothetical protein